MHSTDPPGLFIHFQSGRKISQCSMKKSPKCTYQNSLPKRSQQLLYLDIEQFKGKDRWGVLKANSVCKNQSDYIFITFNWLHFFHNVIPLSSSSIPHILQLPLTLFIIWGRGRFNVLHLYPFTLFFIVLFFSGSLWLLSLL